jgi:NADH:ubiquinone oxidoreductase subunit E
LNSLFVTVQICGKLACTTRGTKPLLWRRVKQWMILVSSTEES